MIRLLDRYNCGGENSTLWFTDNYGPIDVNLLKCTVDRVDHRKWKGKNVAIGKLSVTELLFTLVFLDGLASSIVLIPEEEDSSVCKTLLDQVGIDVVVDNKGLSFESFFLEQVREKSNLNNNLVHSRFKPAQTSWYLPTSGTTGIPKLIPHTFTSLTRSMNVRDIGDKYIWGSLYGLRRFAGLQVFLQSWMCNTPLILREENLDLNGSVSLFTKMGCNALSATPSMWRKILMNESVSNLKLKQITLGGEIVDQPVLDALSNRFPNANITHIYASTEAGVGFVVRDKRSGFPVEYLSGNSYEVEMHINERSHLCFRKKSDQLSDFGKQEKWIDSGDVVQLVNDRVYFLGRANGSINVGGNKVMPEEVESVIKNFPDVLSVRVIARKSTMLGNLVEAIITTESGAKVDSLFAKQIINYCRTCLDEFKVPAFVTGESDISLTSTGKISRKSIE